MNIVLLDGGLGNQLFQIAFALYLTETSPQQTVVSYQTGDKRLKHGVGGLAEIISHFKLPIHAGDGKFLRPFSKLALLRRSLGTRKVFSSLGTIDGAVGFGGSRVFSGYWQNFKKLDPYYSKVALACRDVFKFTPENNAVIHARFGDYNKGINRKIYAPIDADYYFQSLTKLQETVGDQTYKVVSNDLEKAQEWFLSPTFKDFNFSFGSGSALSDFATLAQSSTLIGTNSTFCWWAALAGVESGNLSNLVAPREWFQPPYRHRPSPSYQNIGAAASTVLVRQI